MTPDQGTSSGSNSIQRGGAQIRLAAATARRALLQQAAANLGVDVNDLSIADQIITSRSTNKSVTYGALVGGKAFALKVDKAAPTKNPADFRVVGKSVAQTRHSREGYGAIYLHAGFPDAGNAARPCCAAASDRRHVAKRR